MSDLELEFENDMRYICKESNKIGYNPKIFAGMLNMKGALVTAKQLVMQDQPTAGFTKLFELNRLDLTAESYVVKDKYKELFTEEEIQKSRDRLTDYRYKF